MSGRILLTGSTGFVGGTVRRLLTAAGRPPARCLVHSRPAEGFTGSEIVTADVTDPATLAGVCDGIDVILHVASAVEGDEEHCRRVNDEGTRALVEEAARAGVRRIVYLSTAAVYGDGVFAGIAEGDVDPAPVSAPSRTRLAAEGWVLGAGGTVLRPMYVYGPGDRWFIPSVAFLGQALPYRINGGKARLSVVAVDTLAELLIAAGDGLLPPGVHHASHPEPVSLGEVLDVLTPHLELPPSQGDRSYEEIVREFGLSDDLARRLSHITFDRWFDSGSTWRRAGVDPGASFADRFGEYAAAYQEQLAGS